MINFATLKGLTIPEGNVTQIADSTGRVLWKQAPSGATVNLVVSSNYAKAVIIGGQSYSSSTVLTVPIGTLVTLSGFDTVYLNNRVQTQSGGKYEYTVVGNVDITLTGTKPNPDYTVYIVNITEL
jgi:hypothetical protein